jgi:hypothetical protein
MRSRHQDFAWHFQTKIWRDWLVLSVRRRQHGFRAADVFTALDYARHYGPGSTVVAQVKGRRQNRKI